MGYQFPRSALYAWRSIGWRALKLLSGEKCRLKKTWLHVMPAIQDEGTAPVRSAMEVAMLPRQWHIT